MGKVNLISMADYARHRNVSKAAVSQAVKAGRISLIDGKIDPVAADAQWGQNSRVRVGGAPPQSGVLTAPAGGATVTPAGAPGKPSAQDGADAADDDGNYWNSRSRRESAEARMAELKLAEQEGDLIRTQSVRSALASVLSSTRDALMQIPARLSPVLAAENDAARVHDALQAELHQCLAQLAAAPARLTEGAQAQ